MNNPAIIALLAFIVVVFARYFLKYLNIKHLKKYGNQIPPEFEGHIDANTLEKTMAYTIENARFGYITSLFSNIILIIFLFGGILNWYNSWLAGFEFHFIIHGILFFFIISVINTIISIPFDLYDTFKIENKYGFNTQTPKLWIIDFFKSIIISFILFSLMGSGIFWIIQSSPNWWWLYAWGFIFVFSLFITYISPYVIEPLFNKYDPITEEGLEEKIQSLMKKAGIKVSRVFQMDASKRSKHSNAYFTGFGKTRRIVLFDTLIEQMTHGEILTVLAHEAGHWKKKHVLKSMIMFELISLVSLYVTWFILQREALYTIFGIEEMNIFAGFVLVGFLGGIVSFPFSPIGNIFSRHNEYQADKIACELTRDPQSFISSLIKLSKENLSNLHPHPWFWKFYYSHPPVVERIANIRTMELNTEG